jgi:phosphate-selective porin OprO/OprP
VNVRVGYFKPPISHEDLQSSAHLHLMEYSLLNHLLPDHDTGIMIFGHPAGTVEYQLAVMNGVKKGAGGDVNDDLDWLVRFMLTPFAPGGNKWIKGLALGGSFSWGHTRAADFTNIPGENLGTPTGFHYFSWTGAPHGQRTRYGAELMWYAGPVHLNAEWLRVEQDVAAGGPTVNIPVTAWYVEGGFVLTGEDSTFKGVKPTNPFDPANRKFGAFQICVRYSTLNVDPKAFTYGFAPADHTRSADEYGVCLNWWLNTRIKVQVMYDHTTLARYSGSPASLSDDAILFRFQLKF